MKVLISEVALRRAIAKMLLEARQTVNFLERMDEKAVAAVKNDVIQFLNIVFLNIDDAETHTDNPLASAEMFGTSYNVTLGELNIDSLNGDDLNTIYTGYLAVKFGSYVKTPGGATVPIYDLVGELDGVMISLGYGQNLSIKDLNRFTLNLTRGGPLTAQSDDPSVAKSRDPSAETGTATYYSEEPEPGEPESGRESTVAISDLIDTLVKGSNVTGNIQEFLGKYRAEQVTPLADSLSIIVDAMASAGPIKGLTSIFTVDILNPTELEDVANELLKSYKSPVTLAATAARPPSVAAYSLVDACNLSYGDEKSGLKEFAGLFLVSLVLNSILIARGVGVSNPAFSGAEKRLRRLTRNVEELDVKLATLKGTPQYERFMAVKKELEAIKLEAEKAVSDLKTSKEIATSSPDARKFITPSSNLDSDVIDLKQKVADKALNLARDKQAMSAYLEDYSAYRQALIDEQEKIRKSYDAAKTALEARATRKYESDLALYNQANKSTKGRSTVPVPSLPADPTPDEIISRALGTTDPARIAEFRRVLDISIPPAKPPPTSTSLPTTARAPRSPVKPPLAVGDPSTPEFEAWVKNVETFKQKIDDIETLETLVARKRAEVSRTEGRIPTNVDAELRGIEADIEDAKTIVDRFKKQKASLEDGMPDTGETTSQWVARAVDDFTQIHGIGSLLGKFVTMVALTEVAAIAVAAIYRSFSTWSPDEQLISQCLDRGFTQYAGGQANFKPSASMNKLESMAADVYSSGTIARARLDWFNTKEEEQAYYALARAVAKFASEAVSPSGATSTAAASLQTALDKVKA
jgi:predicted  nucleic acid-binding Zn-ribbon protein